MSEELTIYHTNDIHNRLPGDFVFPQKPDLLVDAGDAIGGSNTLFRFHEPVLCKMRDLGYDCMAMGNREFHYIRSIMKKRREETCFPVLSANLHDLTGRTDGIISPFIIKEIKGIKVAVLGLTVQILPPGSFWEKIFKFKFLDPVTTALEYIPKLREKAHFIIILSHVGKDGDMKIAGTVPGIDLIIGGHSHTPMEKPLEAGEALIVQAGYHAKSFGSLNVKLSKSESNYRLDGFEFELIPFGVKSK
ncbi:MAG: metallophosphoesterase [Candidatus Eremiobacterota bacterium]